ncbi:MarR family winged helix-turn-helix transcriptional regulator [Orenia marismortui]|uniref:DNA-binding MarR family transcriptional regulator n=1 Tax=Orenia marismortui TaxID=46469 RepID=A0A4R8GRC1_9FIRM|nr:MarR family transcriptional regulator [Orenia marismortui]TDX48408.1 DNA-binding MarR family transcriptional regulator [Orenia marismortui]
MKLKDETKEIDYLIRNMNKLLSQYTKEQLINKGLTLPRFKTLWMIAKLEPVNMSQLHEEMYIANSTLTVIVDRLVEDELVRRYRSPKDRRVVLLEVKAKGKECLEKILDIRQLFLEEGIKLLTKEEQGNLIKTLNKVYNCIYEKMEERKG